MRKSKPLISIIVPIYNIQNYLRKCIESIILQKSEDLEIILVDDGSTDSSVEICDEYSREDNRIVVIHKKNGGLVSARNTGLEASQGRYVGYVDGDDWVEENMITVLERHIHKYHPDILCYGFFINDEKSERCYEQTEKSGFYNASELFNRIYPRMLYEDNRRFYTFGIVPNLWAKLVKREILEANKCNIESISYGEDVACSYACILDSKTMYLLSNSLYHYRLNMKSISKAYDPKRFINNELLVNYLEDTWGRKAYDMSKQLKYYRAYLLLQDVLNEAKCKDTIINNTRRLRAYLQQYHLQTVIDALDTKRLSSQARCFFFLMTKNKLLLVTFLCKILIYFHYR